MDGMEIARERIAKEAEEKTGFLDLGCLALSELPDELFDLQHVKHLNLGSSFEVGEMSPSSGSGKHTINDSNEFSARTMERVAALPALEGLYLEHVKISNLSALSGMKRLQALNIEDCDITDISFMRFLPQLKDVKIYSYYLKDFSPLMDLHGLRSLEIRSAFANSCVKFLKNLRNLEELSFNGSGNEDLSGLGDLTGLRKLELCVDSEDISVLFNLVDLQDLTLFLINGDVSSLSGLSQLRCLRLFDPKVRDLSPLASLISLKELNLSGTDWKFSQFTDIGPLSNLQNLETLDLSYTPVTDLRPLAGLARLKELDCHESPIRELTGELPALERLGLYGTQISDVSELINAKSLDYLDVSATHVTNLSPLSGHPALRHIQADDTPLQSAALQNMPSLETLFLGGTQLASVDGFRDLPRLRNLHVIDSRVGDISVVSQLNTLTDLRVSYCPVEDLTPLVNHPSLKLLWVEEAPICHAPLELWRNHALEEVEASPGLPGLPDELLVDNGNCLPAIRAHLDDMEEAGRDFADLKLMVLGNGTVGKTQICRRLREERFDETVASTHGITVTSTPLPADEDGRLNIWDFGGQDIYHNTHTLFAKSRSVFVIVWSRDVESVPVVEQGGMRFYNRPLSYWLEYVKQFGRQGAPIIIVQNKCDTADQITELTLPERWQNDFSFVRVVQSSARNADGMDGVKEALRQCIHHYRSGNPVLQIGASRARVLRQLQDWRDEDAGHPVSARRHRLLLQSEFRSLCDENGGVAAPDYFLQFLHNAGMIFYRKGLFDDQIILDQEWALEGFYALFHRQKVYRQLQERGGVFTREFLGELVWDEAGFSVDDQERLVSMMTSCGLCFLHRSRFDRRSRRSVNIDEYAAPELMADVPNEEGWDHSSEFSVLKITWPFLPEVLIRSIICCFGELAGYAGRYWRTGLNILDHQAEVRVIIDQLTDDGEWSGAIRIRAQGAGADRMINRLRPGILYLGERNGLTSNEGQSGWDDKEFERSILHGTYFQTPWDRTPDR